MKWVGKFPLFESNSRGSSTRRKCLGESSWELNSSTRPLIELRTALMMGRNLLPPTLITNLANTVESRCDTNKVIKDCRIMH
ncbi:hypothetical protein CEXT_251691 [Caerostris extrusa]|uniref:Uncharacterized protein n=1 Tax=Caerostris extrusa TaxID=172846 RepID=A0AAV4YDM1_CAEEX|nr:hypothetical protein CEXT_251691 [Caerostris extrusa]